MIGGISGKDAFQCSRDPGEKSQQQTTTIGLRRRRIFNNDREIGKPAAKWIGEAFQDLVGKLLETLALHRTIVHPAGFRLIPAEILRLPAEVASRGNLPGYARMADNAAGLIFSILSHSAAARRVRELGASKSPYGMMHVANRQITSATAWSNRTAGAADGSWRADQLHARPGGVDGAHCRTRQARHRLQYIRHPSPRSEEHTSELQSRRDLVCRLLLEKKK